MCTFLTFTPLKTNMEPKNEGFEDDFPSTVVIFRFHVVKSSAVEVGLIGPNGCGKSTQLLMLMKQVSPGGGRTLGKQIPDDSP